MTTWGMLLAPARAGWRYSWPAGRAERFALLAILAWAAALRVLFLREPIRFDEAANALYYGDRSLLHALGGMGGNENHGLASLSIWISVRLLGWSEASVRLPTLLCGIALCWVLYAGLRWYAGQPLPALTGAALAAVSPWLVFFSVNARAYVWQTAAVALMVPLVLAVRRGTRIPEEVLGLWAGALTAVGAFAARSMLVPALGLFAGAALLVPRQRLRFFFAWAASAAVLTLAAYSVAVMAHGPAGLLGIAASLRQPLKTALADTASALTAVWPYLFDSSGGRVAWLAGAVLAVGGLPVWRRLVPFGVLVSAVLAAGLAVTALVQVGLYPRVLLPLSALLVPGLALACQGLPGRIRGFLLGAVLVAYPVLWLRQDLLQVRNSTGDIPLARPLAAQLLRRPDLRDSITVFPPLLDVGVAFYLRQASFSAAGIHGYGLGLDPGRHCEYRQVLVFVPNGQGPETVFGEVGKAPWKSRLIRSGAVLEPSSAAGGALLRAPLAPCTSS